MRRVAAKYGPAVLGAMLGLALGQAIAGAMGLSGVGAWLVMVLFVMLVQTGALLLDYHWRQRRQSQRTTHSGR